MDKPVIGIRQADGSFYAIMDDTLPGGHKRVVLSAARTDQRGVKIDLYRSADGTMDGAVALGSLPISDPNGLGDEDIELNLDLDDGVLQATASVAGQPPQSLSVDLAPFQAARSDAAILADDTLADAELDEFDFPEIDPETAAAELPESAETPDLEDLLGEVPEASDTFDLSDFDEGFGSDPAPAADPTMAAPEAAEEWEKISLDDLESMEFMDTGDEISSPSPTRAAPAAAQAEPDFRMDEDQALELGDLDDLGDLPGLDDEPSSRVVEDPGAAPGAFEAPELGSLDRDFMDLESSSEPWTPAAPDPEPKPPKKAKASRSPEPRTSAPLAGVDKVALVLSLVALSLLVLLILVLLFLNLVKAPTVPVIQPEVLQWRSSPQLTESAQAPREIALGASAPSFEATTVLEVPQALRSARMAHRLVPGETVDDATSRFGPPARVEGDLLLW